MFIEPRTHEGGPSVRRRNLAVIDGESVKKKAMISNILQQDGEDEVLYRLIVPKRRIPEPSHLYCE